MKLERRKLLWILAIILVLVSVLLLRPRHLRRVYSAARWRLEAATGIALPHWTSPGSIPAAAYTRIAELPEPFPRLLLSLHKKDPQIGVDGATHQLDPSAGVRPEDGVFIYDLCRRLRPQRTLEVGFAEGFSTLYFLAAIKLNGVGSHIAIDPAETKDWHGIGLRKVQEARMEHHFRFMEAMSISALPAVASESLKFDVIFIDGDHRYDSQLVDFVLSDVVCQQNGFILFHDINMASTKKLVSFIARN